MRHITLFLFFVFTSFIALAQEPIRLTVYPSEVLNPVDTKVYGHFLEHVYNSCNGGLWGELVWNRSFEAGKGGTFQYENGVFKQTSRQGNPVIRLIEGDFTDYEVTLEAKKFSGAEGFLILFRSHGKETYWANLGGWKNRENAVERMDGDAKYSVGRHIPCEPFEPQRTYAIRLVVKGGHFQVFVDGKSVLDVTDEKPIPAGGIGLGTWETAAEFRNVLMKTLDGKILYDGNQPGKMAQKADVRFWTIEDGFPVTSENAARNGEKFIRFTQNGTLSQGHFALKPGETYDFSYWAKGEGTVTFQNQAAQVKSAEWTKVTGSFTVPAAQDSILFQVEPATKVDLDQVSIMPRSWKEKTGGLRPDLLGAIRDIKPAVIRWPGGCYASAYRWKDGIGPQDDRGSFPVELWNDRDVNSFGIDEFMTLCRAVGAEPIMVVDIGTKQWEWTRKPGEKIDLQEAVDWVEYCNGPADSKWGAVRAKNGHPEPYGVKFWEIDNEVHPQHTSVDEYVAVCNELIPRMKAVDPSIHVIACGSWAGGDRFGWDENVGTRVPGIAFVSTHQYDNPDGYAVNPYRNQQFFEARRQILEKSGNPELRFFDSEWNAQSTDWRTGLHAGGILNCFEKAGDVVGMASPALFLRHVSATGWDNAFINFDENGWFPAPNYVVMKLWREHYAPNRVRLSSDSPAMLGEMPLVNAVATRSEDGKQIIVKVVNNQMTDAPIELRLEDLTVSSASAQCVTPPLEQGEEPAAKLKKRNTLDQPALIKAEPLNVELSEGCARAVLPSLSASVFVLKAGEK